MKDLFGYETEKEINNATNKIIATKNIINNYPGLVKFDNTTKSIRIMNFSLTLKNAFVNITSNFGCVMPHHHTFKLYGTERTFIQDYNRAHVIKSREVRNKVFKIDNNYLNKNKKKILESFILSLVSKKKPIVSQSDVINSMAISLTIDKSVKSNKWENIKY